MNSLILLVLAVVAAQAAVIGPTDPVGTIEYHYPDAAEIEASETPESRALARNNINVGSTVGNRLLYRVSVSTTAVAGHIVRVDVTYRTNSAVRIWAIQAFQLSAQDASARIISGGIGQTFVTVRIQSSEGRGYNYQLSFWGR